jgi:Rrf2 family iron-sulfur cluster assembly transcriptional regulator
MLVSIVFLKRGYYTFKKNISLTQIIEAVDENIDLRRCKGMNACNNGKQCISHQLWCDVSKQIRTFLNSKTLQMVIDNHKGL